MARADFGTTFKQTLSRHNCSMEQLAQSTRISLKFIRALGENQFSELPGAVFSRGFIRSICQFLGEDSRNLLAEFEAAMAPPIAEVEASPITETRKAALDAKKPKVNLPKQADEASSEKQEAGEPARKGFSVSGPVVGTCAAVLVVGYVYFRSQNSMVSHINFSKNTPPIAVQSVPGQDEISPETDLSQAEVEANSAAPIQTEPTAIDPPQEQPASPAIVDVSADSSPPLPEVPVPQNEGTEAKQALEITAKEPVRIRLKIDQGESQYIDLPVEKHNFSFSDSADLFIYDAGVVDVSFNGHQLGNLGEKGRKRRLSFRAKQDGAERL